MSLVLEALSWAAMLAGSFILLVTGLGVITLPDYYSRVHAASITDTLGAGLILLGLAAQAGLSLVTVKLLLVLVFLLITGPVASHALAKTAQLHDVPLPPQRSSTNGGSTSGGEGNP